MKTPTTSFTQVSPATKPRLAQTIADTLDRADAQLDPVVIARLERIRQQALQVKSLMSAHNPMTRPWFATAAMVALCALMLGVGHSFLPSRNTTALLTSRSPLPPSPIEDSLPPPEAWDEDPQMLAEWEMLYWLGDEPDAG